MHLRALHPDRDEHLYRQAWAWRLTYPKRVRQWDGLKHFRLWFNLMKRRVSIGVFTDRLVALVTLRPAGNNVYEVHIDCERGVGREALFTALLSLRKTVFEDWGAREVFAGIVSRNFGVISIAETCGFTRDGISEQVGRIKWIRLRMTKDEFDENEHFNQFKSVFTTEPVRTNAGSRLPRHSSSAR